MYLVLPVRWRKTLDERCGIELYDVASIGEFDFLNADRVARAKVNLIRVTHKSAKARDGYGGFGEAFGSGEETDWP